MDKLNISKMGIIIILKISKYILEDIMVIEESEGKYKVQKYPEGPIKIVNRLAIKFKN